MCSGVNDCVYPKIISELSLGQGKRLQLEVPSKRVPKENLATVIKVLLSDTLTLEQIARQGQ